MGVLINWTLYIIKSGIVSIVRWDVIRGFWAEEWQEFPYILARWTSVWSLRLKRSREKAGKTIRMPLK